ncbi:MAG: hypothetical protein E6Q06_04600 [Candidatus Moraniibacteriota bacterium]|nr:MAG: hypothetical protein E6Q06_04600 [Candidatus Moranbacteria bacterium]
MEDKKLKHLELIQGVISRMAGNLFYLRGWIVTLIAGVLVLLTQVDGGKLPIVFLAILTVLFWCYDGYFLSQEKMFRDLYNKVRKQCEEEIDFSMDVKEFQGKAQNTVIFCMFSPTLRYFYGLLLTAAMYVIFYMK